MTREQDEMLVQSCLSGDKSAFGKLVDRYEGALYSAAYGITGSVEDSMDVTQSAFVNAYEKLNTFDPSYRFFSWLYRIALNQAHNLVSRRRPATDIAADMPSKIPGPEAAYSEGESVQFLHRALMELNMEHREVVVLKHIEGYSYREISEIIDVPEKTVKSRLFSARKKLRAVLLKGGYAR